MGFYRQEKRVRALVGTKEVDTAIKSSSWRKKLYRSYDNGATWEEQPLFFELRRLR